MASFRGSPTARCLQFIVLAVLLPKTGLLAGVIDFEDLPSTYMYLGGGQNIGSFYSGLTLGSSVTGLDLTGSTSYPPHSGSIAVWDPSDPVVTVAFDTPQASVGLWYTSFDLLTLASYDAGGDPLESLIAPANTDGTTGESDFISLTDPNISSVTLTGSPGQYVFDDLTFAQAAAPEPASFAMALLLVAFLALRGNKQSSGCPGCPPKCKVVALRARPFLSTDEVNPKCD
jgi:hypothetical protein